MNLEYFRSQRAKGNANLQFLFLQKELALQDLEVIAPSFVAELKEQQPTN